MKKVTAIIKDAKNELVNTIITYMRKLDAYIKTDDKRLMTAPEEDIILTEDEFAVSMPKLRVEVDNSYLDVEDRIYESLPIEKLVLCEYEFYAVVGGVDLDEDTLDTDDLAKIAQFLENEWNKCA